MSKRSLFLIRHAKSSWKNTDLADRQRPLNKRGHRNAVDMATHLSSREPQPDLILTSPAKRARHTAQYFANEFHYPSFDIHIEERLYFRGVKGWLNTLRQLPNDAYSVVCIGHNPEISQCISWLSDFDTDGIPTCTVVKLQIELKNWSELRAEQCHVSYVWSPKDTASLNHSTGIEQKQQATISVKL